jgi:hypothetical protein
MSATRLTLYNGALLECGERELTSLTEAREPRRLLDRVWDTGFVDYCLGQGQWTFAKRSRQLAPSTSITPSYGHQYAYEIPTDHIRTIGVWTDEYCTSPLLSYKVEASHWFTDLEPIYVSYVSNDALYGGDLGSWPADFVRAAETYLAARIVKRLTQSTDEELTLHKKAKALFLDAASGDAMEGPTVFPPRGTWVRARLSGEQVDRGRRNSLIG